MAALLQRSTIAAELTATLGQIAQETRKVGVFCLAIGQQFSSTVMSTPVRNSFVSYVTCRTRREVARITLAALDAGREPPAADLQFMDPVWRSLLASVNERRPRFVPPGPAA